MTFTTDEMQTFECAHCKYAAEENTGRLLSSGSRVCDACSDEYFECSRCECDALCEDSQRTESDESICQRCAGRYYTYSDVQGCYVNDDDVVALQDADSSVSRSWAEANAYSDGQGNWYEVEDNLPSTSIHDYDEDVLKYCEHDRTGLANGSLLFGVELEMEPKSGVSQDDIAKALGGQTCAQYILKEDGSLRDGVELVTIPLTLEGHRNTFNWIGFFSL